MRAQCLAQRRHQVPQDHVEEDARDGVVPVEEMLERVARQDEQERALSRDRGDRRGQTIDEAFEPNAFPAPPVRRGRAGRRARAPSRLAPLIVR